MNMFNELKRRNVFRVGIAYAIFGWVIAQVADLALENFGAPDWVMKTLLFLMFIGFLVSLFIAWAYEMTPEGIKRAEDVDPNQSITHQTGRKLDRLVIVVLLMAVGTLLAERYLVKEEPVTQPSSEVSESVTPESIATPDQEPSVAVLPFVNMSSDPEQEYFSDGISEEILNALTRIPNLKVAARTSSFQFKGQNLDIAKIGQQLQVNHVLEGSVRKAGTTLRITAQLVETDTGFHLWSDTFDRKLEDVFAIQDEIAAAISAELRIRLISIPEHVSTVVNMDAYELYLKGRGLVAKRKAADLFEAIKILESAIEIEPQYAQAMATLAKAYAVLPWYSEQVPSGETRETARLWTTKALEIEPQNPEALAVLAIVLMQVDMNLVGARRLLEQSLELNPGSVAANNFLGDLCLRSGDMECAMIYESRAAELDPLGAVQLTDLAAVYMMRTDYEKVIELAERALALDPYFLHGYRRLVDAYLSLGDAEQIARVIERTKALTSMTDAIKGSFQNSFYIASGDFEQARKQLSQRAQLARSGQLPTVIVATDAVVVGGDFDTAGEMLLQAYREKDGTWLFPVWVRLPEQAPDSKPWQEFWGKPGVAELAELRRSHDMDPFFVINNNGAGE